jgi:hypothetical protein
MTNSVSLGSNPHVFERSVGLRLSYLSHIFSGLLHEWNVEISSCQYVLSLLPRSAPGRASYVYDLALARLRRYPSSNQQDDLDQSIIGFTEAILSLPLPLPFPNINQAFYLLMRATFLRAAESKHPEDVKYSVIYFRYWRGLLHDVHNPFFFSVTRFLVFALALQAELKLEDVDQDIEEMADLCDELLDSDESTDSLNDPIMNFAETIDHHVMETFGVGNPSEKVISCLQKAIIRLPDFPRVSIVLAKYSFCRLQKTVSDDDYNKGMAILHKVISFRGPGDTPSPYQAVALEIAVRFSFVRFETSGKPEHLEQAIYLIRTLLDRLSLEHPARDEIIKQLSFLQEYRIDGSGVNTWEHHVHSQAFDKECAVYSKGIGRGPPSDDRDSDYSSDHSSLWEKDPSICSVESSRYDVSKLEAHLYYFGIRGASRRGPKLIFRTSKDVFTAPSGPEQDLRLMRLLPVYEHHKLGKDDLWATIRTKVRDLLEAEQSAD